MFESPQALWDDGARPGDPSAPTLLDEPKIVSDPRMIRALAHPARITALHHLYAGEELTADQCASLVGIATSAMTYHLRALERWGLVSLRPGSDGRSEAGAGDDVWCACGSSLEVRPGDSMAARTAQSALHHSLVDLLRTDLAGGVAQAPAEQAKQSGSGPTGFTVVPLLLTDAEAAELNSTVMALLERFGHRAPDELPPDTRRYHVYWGPVPLTTRTATVRPLPGIAVGTAPEPEADEA
jgi:DNA-binding transcriptional ArsR family regulator